MKLELPMCQAKCGDVVEGSPYKFCYKCWWNQDPRNIKNGGTVDLEKYKMSEYPITTSVDEKGPELKKDNEGPQPGPTPPPRSVNNRVIVESYKEDRALKATVQNGFAMVTQKVSVKGLKALADARIGDEYIRKGDTVYIRESSLQSQAWAKASFTSDGIEGEFMIVDATHVEFVGRQ